MTFVRVARLRDDEGFTLIELLIGIVITGLLFGVIAGALIVGLRTTDETSTRLGESHDAQVASAYLAKDVQSADSVTVPGLGSSCGPMKPLVDFGYGGGTASYCWGQAGANQEIQITRSYGGNTAVIAHFANSAADPSLKPNVTCSPDPCTGTTKPNVVQIDFTEASGYQFTLLGSRRTYNVGGGPGTPPTPPLTLLATGSGSTSPLWVLGGCKSSGTKADCIPPDTATNSLPISDLVTTSWTTTPLWSKLSDGSDDTFVVNNPGTTSQAKVALASVAPPVAPTLPTIDVRAEVAIGDKGPEKLTLYLYEGATLRATSSQIQIDRTAINDYPWVLTRAETASIKSYANLSVGFAMTSGTSAEKINVYGVSLDTVTPADTSALGNPVLTINGYLDVNSTLPDAVRLTGTKNKTKLAIVDVGSGSGFNILDLRSEGGGTGRCSGCTHQTVTCDPTTTCTWKTPTEPWSPLYPKMPDPLRFMAVPTDAGVPTTSSCPSGYRVYQPGVYSSELHITTDACLEGGIYTLGGGMKVEGGANVVGQGVMLFNRGGPQEGGITFGGGANVQLTAYDSYPYRNILIFQARCTGDNPIVGCTDYNNKPITLTGGTVVNGPGGTPASFLGIIYAPASTAVTLGTGGANMRVTAVIAQNITVTGNSLVTIG